jgi:hypothetical protein
MFIFDVNTEKYIARNKSNSTSWKLYADGGYWNAEPHICLEATHLYENDTVAADQYVVITNDAVKEYINWFATYTIPKLADEVSPFGFSIKSVFDDVSGSPYTSEGEEMCFVLEKSVETG